MLANDEAIKWAKARVFVYADSVLGLGETEEGSGAAEKWKGKLEDIKMYSPYRDAVGIDGEAIELEWKKFQDFFKIVHSSRDPERLDTEELPTEGTKSSSCQCSKTSCGSQLNRNCISNAEKVNDYAKQFLPGHWTFLGPGSETTWYGGSHEQQLKESRHPIFTDISA